MNRSRTRIAWALALGMVSMPIAGVVPQNPSAIGLGSFTLPRAYEGSSSPFLLSADAAEGSGEPSPPTDAAAASTADAGESPSTPWSLRAGIGFALSPDTFLLTLEAPCALTESLRLGPLLQFGVDDDHVILAPSANLQYVFDLSGVSADLKDLKPFVQGGIGFAYFHRDHPFEDNDDVGFLINVGFGFEYYLTEKLALGNNLLFNILPVDALGDHFFFSWQFVTVTFRF